MGKLHTLRRAIEREPDKWIWKPRYFNIRPRDNERRAYGAHHGYPDSRWHPSWSNHSYRAFVRSALRKLGYMVK